MMCRWTRIWHAFIFQRLKCMVLSFYYIATWEPQKNREVHLRWVSSKTTSFLHVQQPAFVLSKARKSIACTEWTMRSEKGTTKTKSASYLTRNNNFLRMQSKKCPSNCRIPVPGMMTLIFNSNFTLINQSTTSSNIRNYQIRKYNGND